MILLFCSLEMSIAVGCNKHVPIMLLKLPFMFWSILHIVKLASLFAINIHT